MRRSFLILRRRAHRCAVSVKSILYWKKKVASTSNCVVAVRARSQQLFCPRNHLVTRARVAFGYVNKRLKIKFNCRLRCWLKPLRKRSLLPAICSSSKWTSHTYVQSKNKFKKTNVLLNKTTRHSETLVISHCLCSCEGCLTLMGYADWLFYKFSQL